jgi:NAD(P)-dependent dehydrogenase (short-subunit alcohol dehydrogenase family)
VTVKQAQFPGSRVAIVTGAGIGLGRAYALELARRGLRVVVNNRRREVDALGRGSADRVVAEIRAAGGEAIADYEDVCDDGAGERMVQRALQAWGRLDALVNNAGVDQHAPFHRIDLAEFRRIFEVNFFGTLQVTHAAWAPMRAAGHGRIVVSTSSAGLHGLHGLSAYAASKAALIGLARTLAAEGASRDVFCNAIAPYAATRMTEAHLDAAAREAMAPERVAPLVAELVSAESRINGEVIVAGLGWARRATTVELEPGIAADFFALQNDPASVQRKRLEIPGVCAEFGNALQSFADFEAAARGGLQPAASRDSLR